MEATVRAGFLVDSGEKCASHKMMLAQAEGGFPSPLTELGAGVGGSTLAVLFLLVATLILLRVVYGQRRGRRNGGLLRVDAQVELSPNQSLYLVRAAGRCLLVGGTSGSLALLAELDPAQVADLAAEAPTADISKMTMTEKLRALVRAPSR